MNLPMGVALQHFLWFGLFALGLEFLAIATRLREDRTLPSLGGSILLLSLMVGLDVWITIPGIAARDGSAFFLEAAQDMAQVLACAYVAVSLWFVRGLTGLPSSRATRGVTLFLSLMALAFWADALTPGHLFLRLENWEWITTPAYDWVFAPGIISAFAWVLWLAFSGWRKAQGHDKRSLGYLCLAYSVLIVSGITDFIMLWNHSGYSSNFTLYGTLAMGVMATFIFTDKLIHMYQRRRGSLLEIAEIRETLEAQRPLGELGRSATQVSDQIRSYVSSLKQDSQNLKQEVSREGARAGGERVELRRIDEARKRLELYANGILDYSASSRLGTLAPVDPARLLERCVRERFASESGRIAVVGAPGVKIMADAARLERAFGELLANALEAGSPWIEARVRRGMGLVSIAIEDAGCGCPEDLCETIGQPFFTTRKRQGHHGLGASIALSTLRAHGGSLRFLPKPEAGLIANVVLPAAGEFPAGARGGDAEAALISGNRPRIARFQALCANLGLRPLILAPGARFRPDGRPICVVADPGADAEPPAAWRHVPFRRLDYDGCFPADPSKRHPARTLSEEAILEWLAPG